MSCLNVMYISKLKCNQSTSSPAWEEHRFNQLDRTEGRSTLECGNAFQCFSVTYPTFVFNRPGVAGAVLQSPPSLTDSVSQSVRKPFSPDLHNIINNKQ